MQTRALMDSACKREMTIGGTPHVEALGLRELFGIPVSGADAERYQRARRHGDTPQGRRLQHAAVP